MQVKDIIVTPVTACDINSDIGQVRDLMNQKKISALPVVHIEKDSVKLRGIVSFQDLAGVYDDSINVQQVMTTDVVAVSPEATIQEAARTMIDRKIHHLVVSDKGDIKGIVSSLDFVKLVAESSL